MLTLREELAQNKKEKRTDFILTFIVVAASCILVALCGCRGGQTVDPLVSAPNQPPPEARIQEIKVRADDLRAILQSHFSPIVASKPVATKIALPQEIFDFAEVHREMLVDTKAQVQSEFVFSAPNRTRSGVITLFFTFQNGVWERDRSEFQILETEEVFGIVGVAVVDALIGDPITGARVFFRRVDADRTSEVVTSHNGAAVVRVLRGRHTLVVEHPDFQPFESKVVQIQPGSQLYPLPVYILSKRSTPDRVEVQFQIRDHLGNPVPKVVLTFTTSQPDILPPMPTLTDSEGSAIALVLPEVEYTAEGARESGETEVLTFSVSPQEPNPARSLIFRNSPPEIRTEFEQGSANVSPGQEVQIRIFINDVEDQNLTVTFGADNGTLDFERSSSRRVIWTAPSTPGTSTITIVVSDGFGGVTIEHVEISTNQASTPGAGADVN